MTGCKDSSIRPNDPPREGAKRFPELAAAAVASVGLEFGTFSGRKDFLDDVDEEVLELLSTLILI